MLKYCEKCEILTENTECPNCNSNKLREPNDNDPVFLCEKQVTWAEVLKEVLEKNDIPVVFKGELGAGMSMKLGKMAERMKIFVPFSRFKEAEKILDELFSADKGH